MGHPLIRNASASTALRQVAVMGDAAFGDDVADQPNGVEAHRARQAAVGGTGRAEADRVPDLKGAGMSNWS